MKPIQDIPMNEARRASMLEDRYACPKCPRRFCSRRSLGGHLAAHQRLERLMEKEGLIGRSGMDRSSRMIINKTPQARRESPYFWLDDRRVRNLQRASVSATRFMHGGDHILPRYGSSQPDAISIIQREFRKHNVLEAANAVPLAHPEGLLRKILHPPFDSNAEGNNSIALRPEQPIGHEGMGIGSSPNLNPNNKAQSAYPYYSNSVNGGSLVLKDLVFPPLTTGSLPLNSNKERKRRSILDHASVQNPTGTSLILTMLDPEVAVRNLGHRILNQFTPGYCTRFAFKDPIPQLNSNPDGNILPYSAFVGGESTGGNPTYDVLASTAHSGVDANHLSSDHSGENFHRTLIPHSDREETRGELTHQALALVKGDGNDHLHILELPGAMAQT